MLPTGSQNRRFSNPYVEVEPEPKIKIETKFESDIGTLMFSCSEIQCDSGDALERA